MGDLMSGIVLIIGGIVLGFVSGIVLWKVFLKYILKDTAKLSIKASNIIFDVKRTEINPGNGNNGKIAINELLSLHADPNGRKFIKNYAETKSAFDGIAITISAYLFAIFTLLIALYTNVLQSLQMHPDIMPLIFAAISLMLMTIIFRFGHMMNRNEAIIMSIEDEWDDQDESHIDSNTKNTKEDDATMNTGYKTAMVMCIFGALMTMGVISMIKYYLAVGWDAFGPLSNIILVTVLVGVTLYYAGQVAKQTNLMKIDRVSKEMDKLVAPLDSMKDNIRMFNCASTNNSLMNNDPSYKVAHYEFWASIKQNKYRGPLYLRSAIDDYLGIASASDRAEDAAGRVSTPKSKEILEQLSTAIKSRYGELETELLILTEGNKASGKVAAFWMACGALFMIVIYKIQGWL